MSNVEKNLIEALLYMTDQYLKEIEIDEKTEYLTHNFMVAGETALGVLEDMGYVKNLGYEKYGFTEKVKEIIPYW